MRQLEVVAVSDDGSYVLLASDENAARATHAVRIDSRLHAALRGALDEDSDDRRESELSPRDIQARLRAGETPEAVAKAANVSLPRVMRYAGPVFSERERIVDQAKAAMLKRPRGPEPTTPLGLVVEKHLAETVGLRPDTVVWAAKRRDDGSWIIELSYSARGGSRSAQWLWQPGDRELTSLNALATRLGVEGAGKPTSVRRSARPAPAGNPARRKPATKQRAAKKAAAQKPAAQSVAAKKVAAKRPTTAGPAAKKTAPQQTAAKRATVKRAPVKKAAPKPRTPRSERPLIEPSVKRVNGRVEVPSWSDVLLGVQTPAPTRGRRRS